MKCAFCGRELRYDFEIKVGICELCQMRNKLNRKIKILTSFIIKII